MIKQTIYIVLCFWFISPLWTIGQTVPSVIDFAGMKLKLTEDARRDIQADVDALTRSEKYFRIKLDRVNMYMPIIERVLQEEGVPVDFKYLVIQESALISDAVSSSNAIGFWQFKVPAAEEVGMKVNMQVDERMNIVSSTKGAAKYLKINHQQFGNWVYALLAYNTGRGGAANLVNDKYFGARQMPIDRKTHWYVKKFLAHKVAFEGVIGTTNGEYKLMEYREGANKSLKQIGNEFNIDADLMEEFNKWLRRGKVPDDKIYTVIIPLRNLETIPPSLLAQQKSPSNEYAHLYEGKLNPEEQNQYPIVKRHEGSVPNKPFLVKINGLKGIVAAKGYTAQQLADFANIKYERFMDYNDMSSRDQAVAGNIYYIQKKRNKARVYYHTVAAGETWWDISQKYGIKQSKLLVKNRLRKPEQLKEGRILWLRNTRPRNVPVEYAPVPPQPVPEKVPEEITDENGFEADTTSYTADPTPQLTVPEPIHQDSSYAIQENGKADSTDVLEQNSMANEIGTDTDIAERETLAEEEPPHGEELKVEEPTHDRDETKPMYHDVRANETLYGISRKYEVTIDQLKTWNQDMLADGLKSGQRLKLFDGSIDKKNIQQKKQTETTGKEDKTIITYTVKAGDTLYKIAKDHEVSFTDLLKWNNKDDFNIKEGEELKIYK